jgi:hypothetical protein
VLAFHQNLEHKKQPDKKQKSNEYFVIPAIENFVCGYVFLYAKIITITKATKNKAAKMSCPVLNMFKTICCKGSQMCVKVAILRW